MGRNRIIMDKDAQRIIDRALADAMPENAVRRSLGQITLNKEGRTVLVAIGKAGWSMAKAAWNVLGNSISGGVVITKYDHSKGPIGNLEIWEAGHPVSDANSYKATDRALSAVSGLGKNDNVLFLISGGGSALFEKPLIDPAEQQDITKQLLACGASIVEINTIRKRLSAVKGGRFALCCAPAHVYAIILSDIIGDPLDMIASGPAYPDSSTASDAEAIVKRYDLKLSSSAMSLLKKETPKKLDNVTSIVIGSVRQLCASAADEARKMGYEPIVLTTSLDCEAREAGAFLAAIARSHQDDGKSLAVFAGGETVVHLTGKGKGGRNQEIALGAARGIRGLKDTVVFSFGSDGTDGPTDAAGGWADGKTMDRLEQKGLDWDQVMRDNDAYHALKAIDGLVMTGPTGTNVNDLSGLLIKR